MARALDKRKYIIVGAITLIVFILGVSLGTILDYERYRSVYEINKEQEMVFNSLQLQYLYLTELEHDEEVCAAIYSTLEDSVMELGKSLDDIVNYEENSRLNKRSYVEIKRKYVLDNIRYWMFAKKAKERCGKDLVTILYFNSENGCSDCNEQGTFLTYYKTIYEDKLLVFPLDVGLKDNEGMLKILFNQYNLTHLPTLIIGDDKYEGIVGKEALKELICSEFNNKSLCVN